tara:strand:+ start:4847 stop:5953 length:1107 start_codon:yes stop_codon:yes gene_type:complete
MAIINADITLGILGGGQLGRMSAMAAARLGIAVIIYSPEQDCPASYVAKETIVASYDDQDALKAFCEKTDIITYEFENIPLKTIEYIETLKANAVLPEKTLLDVSQDRIKEKTFLNEQDIQTTRWAAVRDLNDIQATATLWGSPRFILKTARFGYDGKGQIKCEAATLSDDKDLQSYLEETKGHDIIMEDFVPFTKEISIIIARDVNGKTELYGPMLNEHKNHILHKTTMPCDIAETIKDKAFSVSKTISEAISLIGVLTVEFFVCDDGTLLVNEIAPRTHNSGHWTVDACCVSQFENHVRTVCGLPVGSSKRHSDATMLNLIGDDINHIDHYLDDDCANIHLYGKKQVKKGRKMGHVTILSPKTNAY